jgi:hypothetical protein
MHAAHHWDRATDAVGNTAECTFGNPTRTASEFSSAASDSDGVTEDPPPLRSLTPPPVVQVSLTGEDRSFLFSKAPSDFRVQRPVEATEEPRNRFQRYNLTDDEALCAVVRTMEASAPKVGSVKKNSVQIR